MSEKNSNKKQPLFSKVVAGLKRKYPQLNKTNTGTYSYVPKSEIYMKIIPLYEEKGYYIAWDYTTEHEPHTVFIYLTVSLEIYDKNDSCVYTDGISVIIQEPDKGLNIPQTIKAWKSYFKRDLLVNAFDIEDGEDSNIEDNDKSKNKNVLIPNTKEYKDVLKRLRAKIWSEEHVKANYLIDEKTAKKIQEDLNEQI